LGRRPCRGRYSTRPGRGGKKQGKREPAAVPLLLRHLPQEGKRRKRNQEEVSTGRRKHGKRGGKETYLILASAIRRASEGKGKIPRTLPRPVGVLGKKKKRKGKEELQDTSPPGGKESEHCQFGPGKEERRRKIPPPFLERKGRFEVRFVGGRKEGERKS